MLEALSRQIKVRMSRRIALCRRLGISDSLENEAWSVKEEDVIRLKTDDAILIR